MRSACTRAYTSLTSCGQITDTRAGVTGAGRGMHSVRPDLASGVKSLFENLSRPSGEI